MVWTSDCVGGRVWCVPTILRSLLKHLDVEHAPTVDKRGFKCEHIPWGGLGGLSAAPEVRGWFMCLRTLEISQFTWECHIALTWPTSSSLVCTISHSCYCGCYFLGQLFVCVWRWLVGGGGCSAIYLVSINGLDPTFLNDFSIYHYSDQSYKYTT